MRSSERFLGKNSAELSEAGWQLGFLLGLSAREKLGHEMRTDAGEVDTDIDNATDTDEDKDNDNQDNDKDKEKEG